MPVLEWRRRRRRSDVGPRRMIDIGKERLQTARFVFAGKDGNDRINNLDFTGILVLTGIPHVPAKERLNTKTRSWSKETNRN